MEPQGKKIPDLSEYDGEDQVISSYEMEEQLQDEKHLFKVRTMIPGLDRHIDGCVPGEVIIISGFTKHGKTLLAQTLTKNFSQQDQLSLWFSYELPPKQFIACFDNLPLIYMPRYLRTASLKWVKDRIIESFQKYHTRIIFIDHLHYLVDMTRQKGPSLEIGTIIRCFKSLAVTHGFVIFILSHTRTKKDGQIEVDDFGSPRDSSFIEQESDATLMVKRFPKFGSNIAKIRINQHRRTGVMDEKVWVEKIGSVLVETTERKDTRNQRLPYSDD